MWLQITIATTALDVWTRFVVANGFQKREHEVVRQVGVVIPQEIVVNVPVPQIQTVEKVVEVPQVGFLNRY